jgi:hypothetical protein
MCSSIALVTIYNAQERLGSLRRSANGNKKGAAAVSAVKSRTQARS